MSVQLRHERLTEAHHLVVRAAPRVEVAAALAATDTEAGQGVLEHLLETEELHDAQVHRRVEAQTALVGAERAVELDPETPVDADSAFVVLPRHPEEQLSFWLAQPLDERSLSEFRPAARTGARVSRTSLAAWWNSGSAGFRRTTSL